MNATYCLWPKLQLAAIEAQGKGLVILIHVPCHLIFYVKTSYFCSCCPLTVWNYYPLNPLDFFIYSIFQAFSFRECLLLAPSFFPLYFALPFVFCTATQLTEGLEDANSKLTISGYFSREWKKKCNFWIDVGIKTDLIKITWSRWYTIQVEGLKLDNLMASSKIGL